MARQPKINASDDAWDSGELGKDEQFVGVVQDGQDDVAIDESLGLKPVSLRLQSSLIDDFKTIAKLNGIGYQTLMRQVLTRFAIAEKKRVFNQVMSDIQAQAEEEAAHAKGENNADKKIA